MKSTQKAALKEYAKAGYIAGLKATATKSDNFTKPETDDDEWLLTQENGQEQLEWKLMNRAWSKRNLNARWGFSDDYDKAKNMLKIFDGLGKNAQECVKNLWNSYRDTQFVVEFSDGMLVELKWSFGGMEVRKKPKGKFEELTSDELAVWHWLDDNDAKFIGYRWPSSAGNLPD